MKKILIACGALVALLLVAAAIAPKEFKIEKSITISKPKAEVFAYLKMMENGKKWQPWSKLDLNMTQELKGVDGTVGAIQSWSGNKEVGVGEQEIKAIAENERIDFELRFAKPMETVNNAYFTTEEVSENETKVTWAMLGRTKFPFNLVCFLMHGKVEKNFAQGLSDLKVILESEAAALSTPVEGEAADAAAPVADASAPTSTVTTTEVTKETVKTEEVKK